MNKNFFCRLDYSGIMGAGEKRLIYEEAQRSSPAPAPAGAPEKKEGEKKTLTAADKRNAVRSTAQEVYKVLSSVNGPNDLIRDLNPGGQDNAYDRSKRADIAQDKDAETKTAELRNALVGGILHIRSHHPNLETQAMKYWASERGAGLEEDLEKQRKKEEADRLRGTANQKATEIKSYLQSIDSKEADYIRGLNLRSDLKTLMEQLPTKYDEENYDEYIKGLQTLIAEYPNYLTQVKRVHEEIARDKSALTNGFTGAISQYKDSEPKTADKLRTLLFNRVTTAYSSLKHRAFFNGNFTLSQDNILINEPGTFIDTTHSASAYVSVQANGVNVHVVEADKEPSTGISTNIIDGKRVEYSTAGIDLDQHIKDLQDGQSLKVTIADGSTYTIRKYSQSGFEFIDVNGASYKADSREALNYLARVETTREAPAAGPAGTPPAARVEIAADTTPRVPWTAAPGAAPGGEAPRTAAAAAPSPERNQERVSYSPSPADIAAVINTKIGVAKNITSESTTQELNVNRDVALDLQARYDNANKKINDSYSGRLTHKFDNNKEVNYEFTIRFDGSGNPPTVFIGKLAG